MILFGIKIIFVAKSHSMINVLKEYFGNTMNIGIVKCDLSQIKADCIVCPSDSYGLMENSISQRINKIIKIDNIIRHAIDTVYFGEQPVGTCLILNTNDEKYRYVAHLPITRVQSDISKTYNVYIAFRALLTAVLQHNMCNDNKIKTILCTPFGVWDGGMDTEESVRQMKLAHSLIDLDMKCNKENSISITEFLK